MERKADLYESEATLAYTSSSRTTRKGHIVIPSSITIKNKIKFSGG